MKNLVRLGDKSKPDVIIYLLDSTRENTSKQARVPTKKNTADNSSKEGAYVPNWIWEWEQNNDLVGKVALRRLCDALNRNASRSGETSNLVTLVPPTWIESSSAKEKKV